jgi:predicted signal transduction protein with EAL and GGDEF domain
VAEGVETPEQFETLAHLGRDQSQGYLHSRPLSVADIEPLLKNGSLPASSNGSRHNVKSNQEVTPFAHQG